MSEYSSFNGYEISSHPEGYEFFTQDTWESEWFPGCEVRVFDLLVFVTPDHEAFANL